MGIGQRIRLAIEAQGLSLRQASEKCQISYSSLQNWAGGHRDPRPDALVTLGSQLGISIDWLLTGEGAMLRGQEASEDRLATHEPRNPREAAILQLFRELDEASQLEIQRAAEEKKRLTNLEQRLAELEAVVANVKRLA